VNKLHIVIDSDINEGPFSVHMKHSFISMLCSALHALGVQLAALAYHL